MHRFVVMDRLDPEDANLVAFRERLRKRNHGGEAESATHQRQSLGRHEVGRDLFLLLPTCDPPADFEGSKMVSIVTIPERKPRARIDESHRDVLP
jgi:hypothetical protein